jgi:hypothetical protein
MVKGHPTKPGTLASQRDVGALQQATPAARLRPRPAAQSKAVWVERAAPKSWPTGGRRVWAEKGMQERVRLLLRVAAAARTPVWGAKQRARTEAT